MRPRAQIVWWPRRWRIWLTHDQNTALHAIYRWRLAIGPIEIRRWR